MSLYVGIILLVLYALRYLVISSTPIHHRMDLQVQDNAQNRPQVPPQPFHPGKEWRENSQETQVRKKESFNRLPSEDDASSPCPKPEAKVCENASLPELIFVVGVSGSGHGLIKALVSKMSDYGIAEFLPFVHIYEPGSDSGWSNLHYAIVEKQLLRERLQYVVDLLTSAQSEGKRGVVLVANSFPMGKDAGMFPTGRPDLINLNKFDCELYRLKFVVIRRHPLASVVASVDRYCDASHCNFTAAAHKWKELNAATLPYTAKARILESELIYIQQQLLTLDCHQPVYLEHDRLYNKATRRNEAVKLISFLELHRVDEVLDSIMSAELPAPKSTVAIPPLCSVCIEKTLYDFFERRKAMWPLLIPSDTGS